jgi:hypothetical protein
VAKLRSQWTAIRGTQRQPPGVGLGEVLNWATDRRAAKVLAAGLAWQPEQTRTPVEIVREEPADGRRTRRPNAFTAQVPEGLLSIGVVLRVSVWVFADQDIAGVCRNQAPWLITR